MKFWLGLLLAVGQLAAADQKSTLTLAQYLDDVKQHNPAARAAVQSVESYQLRVSEAEVPLFTNLYADYMKKDDQKPTQVPAFMGTETRTEQWQVGLRKQTEFGTQANLYFNSLRTNIMGIPPGSFFPVPNYMESSAVLELTQSLWQNGFGEGTRAQIEANRQGNDSNIAKSKFDLKSILLNAENAYWSVACLNEIVKLQQENVDRAKKLRDYMSGRKRLKLVDDTDSMQAEASYQSRELDLQTSLDQRAVLVRNFNTLRGLDSETVGDLETVPTQAMMKEVAKATKGRMTREDFDQLRAQAKAGVAQAKFANSQIQPQLDLKGSVATNGHDGLTSASYYQVGTDRYPTWSFGVVFSVPLDFGLISDIKRGYRQARASAEELEAQAQFSEKRAWDDLVHQKTEAQGRFDRASNVESIQTQLVKREHVRLHNGRTTTFETLQFEQNLALAQIQRVQTQLDLLKIHNALKTFEAHDAE